jgi:hypothetical protein
MTFLKFKISLSVIVFAVLLPLFSVMAEERLTSADFSPTILETTKIIEGQEIIVAIKGLVKPGNEVLIYLNGKYNGIANVSQINDSFSSFSYLSTRVKITEADEVLAISRNTRTKELSSPTQSFVSSIIEKSFIAPHPKNESIVAPKKELLAPTLKNINQNDCLSKPYISGFSKNKTIVRIYIDNELYEKFAVNEEKQDIVYFTYVPSVPFGRGQHFVYATAEHENGQISQKSNSVSFCTLNPDSISTSTADEEPIIAEIINKKDQKNNSIYPEKLDFNKKNNKNTLNFIPLNYLLFLVFILAIIIWIFLVNKELSKEIDDKIENKDLPK